MHQIVHIKNSFIQSIIHSESDHVLLINILHFLLLTRDCNILFVAPVTCFLTVSPFSSPGSRSSTLAPGEEEAAAPEWDVSVAEAAVVVAAEVATARLAAVDPGILALLRLS